MAVCEVNALVSIDVDRTGVINAFVHIGSYRTVFRAHVRHQVRSTYTDAVHEMPAHYSEWLTGLAQMTCDVSNISELRAQHPHAGNTYDIEAINSLGTGRHHNESQTLVGRTLRFQSEVRVIASKFYKS